MVTYFFYVLTGWVCIFFLQKFPFSKLLYVGKWWQEGGFLYELFACDLCLGVWVYTFLAFCFSINLFEGWFYKPVLSELLTGASTSLLAHLIRLGWQTKFCVIEVR